ncbi:rCG24934, isoform CRA_c [Rattus norvegicus]|uniref:RCG24934, isoform CRA_c n=1 Tax=Rattus norvegicus TaxID=10116 RepID=A6KLR7_RAT|nr:rCG24934, isoform CRA_c [Rattus norvegicus]
MISPQLCPPQMDVQTLLVRQCVLLFTDCSKRQNATPSGKGGFFWLRL